MIVMLQETSTVISLLDERGITDQVMAILPNKTSGSVYKTEHERMYIIKFAHEEYADELVCAHLVKPTEEELAKAEEWYFSIIDPSTMIGGSDGDFQA